MNKRFRPPRECYGAVRKDKLLYRGFDPEEFMRTVKKSMKTLPKSNKVNK